jgi:hypothetical protein
MDKAQKAAIDRDCTAARLYVECETLEEFDEKFQAAGYAYTARPCECVDGGERRPSSSVWMVPQMKLKHCQSCGAETTHSATCVTKPGSAYLDYAYDHVWECFTCRTQTPRKIRGANHAKPKQRGTNDNRQNVRQPRLGS